jgi:hypothetical protein
MTRSSSFNAINGRRMVIYNFLADILSLFFENLVFSYIIENKPTKGAA